MTSKIFNKRAMMMESHPWVQLVIIMRPLVVGTGKPENPLFKIYMARNKGSLGKPGLI
jgi:hypothetical protein